jgi:hypothetical protein
MAKFQKGNSGRKAGSANKFTKTVKEAFEIAFNELQGDKDANLVSWAKNNTTDFYKLASKLIPTSVNADITSKDKELKQWTLTYVDGNESK